MVDNKLTYAVKRRALEKWPETEISSTPIFSH